MMHNPLTERLRLCYSRSVLNMKPASIPASKILLVDDNRDGLTVRRLLLEELGYCVQVAEGGEEALKLLSSGTFDVVVTDYRMPDMNGTKLISRIRALNPDARVILLSGFVEPLGLTEENTGANAVITKSSNEAAQLTRWVKRLVNVPTRRKPPVRQTGGTRSAVRRNLAH
jgi:CheY-like chemotaxis protein